MNKTLQLFEHEKLTIHDNREEKFSKKHLDKLYAFNDANENKYFTGIRDGVKFTEYVGVIQVGNLTIEILPKADKNSDKTIWRNALLKMLGICKKINLESITDANLSKRNNSLLDLYFDRFLNEVEKLLHKGLIKKYRNESSNVLALKGRLNFAKQIQQNLIHQERFFTQHQTYDQEHLLNQVLLKALRILNTIVSNPLLKDRIKKIGLAFPEIKEINITETLLDSIKLNRKSLDYKEALQIAKMIILHYSPDIKGGNENMIALLFNMNSLWEEYIYRMLQKYPQQEFEIYNQQSQNFWQSKTIRPDIVLIKKKTKETFIIDTKWKVVNNTNPSDDDLKQMFAYNQYWSATKSILLYPNIENFKEYFGKFHKGIQGENHCKMGFVIVLENGSLDMNIGEKILNKLSPTSN